MSGHCDNISDAEVQEILAKASAPRVTEESIKDKIMEVDYLYHGYTTICVMTLSNGFKLIGHSTPASPANFDKAVGRKYAFDNAFKQAWPLYGFLLRQRLYEEAVSLSQ